MRKFYYLILFIFAVCPVLYSQISTQRVPISETYSSNGEFKLESISYDDEFPNLKGRSTVNTKENDYDYEYIKKFYELDRSFDMYDGYPYFAAISNDGRKIVYIKNVNFYRGKEHEMVTFYLDGKLQKIYTTEEFINCDKDKEKCEMFYENQQQVFLGGNYTTYQFKEGISDEEKYLSRNFVFNKNDTIYLVDGRKQVTLFDLNNNKIIKNNVSFKSIYPKMKKTEVKRSNVSYYKYPYKYVIDIENTSNNEKISETISKFSNLKFISVNDSTFHKFKLYRVELTGYVNRNGKFEIEKFETDSIFDSLKIRNHVENTIFKTDFIPREVDKIYVSRFYGGYRNFDDKIAEEDTKLEKLKSKKEFEKRLTLDKIEGVYIPKNLYECLLELDKTLNFENKKELKNSKDISQYNSHVGGLGMWIRNNWGINGGSRLLKYFNDRNVGKKIFENDDISGIIISQYILWLNGNKDAWKKWEKKHKAQK